MEAEKDPERSAALQRVQEGAGFWLRSRLGHLLKDARSTNAIPRNPGYYNGWPNPEQITTAWDNFNEKSRHDEVLFPFGFGDGGGGPTEEMLEFAARSERFPGLPACRQGLEEDYFRDVRAAGAELPTWVGELYLETHRGTYTTHGEIKNANRQGELALRDAEIAGLMAAAAGRAVDLSPLHGAWRNLLLLQFHDILPGSSIGEVYSEAAADHGAIIQTGRAVRDEALQAVAGGVSGPSDLNSWLRNWGASTRA
jgi:alpha-mannosidase